MTPKDEILTELAQCPKDQLPWLAAVIYEWLKRGKLEQVDRPELVAAWKKRNEEVTDA